MVITLETGGRWSDEAATFLEELAHTRARDAPPALRFAAVLAWQRRWSRLLATATANAFASSLVTPASDSAVGPADGPTPALCDLLCSGACGAPAAADRQPLRGCCLLTGLRLYVLKQLFLLKLYV